LHGGSEGGAANVGGVAALAVEFGNQTDTAKRQQRKQPEDTHNDGKPMRHAAELAFACWLWQDGRLLFPAGWKPAFQDGQDGHPPTAARPQIRD